MLQRWAPVFPDFLEPTGYVQVARFLSGTRFQPVPRLGFSPGAHPARNLRRWHRSGNGVTLRVIAADLEQQAPMLYGFNPLGDDAELERGSKADNAAHDGQVIRVSQHIVDKALINLEDLSR